MRLAESSSRELRDLENKLGLSALSWSMEDEDRTYRIRQGFWLRMAREANNLNQIGAAKLVGLTSKSAISDYESGDTPVPMARLRRFANVYGWDLSIFTEPDLTAEEQARERMAQLARAAISLAAEDRAAEAAARQPSDGRLAQPRRRRSA